MMETVTNSPITFKYLFRIPKDSTHVHKEGKSLEDGQNKGWSVDGKYRLRDDQEGVGGMRLGQFQESFVIEP